MVRKKNTLDIQIIIELVTGLFGDKKRDSDAMVTAESVGSWTKAVPAAQHSMNRDQTVPSGLSLGVVTPIQGDHGIPRASQAVDSESRPEGGPCACHSLSSNFGRCRGHSALRCEGPQAQRRPVAVTMILIKGSASGASSSVVLPSSGLEMADPRAGGTAATGAAAEGSQQHSCTRTAAYRGGGGVGSGYRLFKFLCVAAGAVAAPGTPSLCTRCAAVVLLRRATIRR
jgi:hypothetical protein